MAKQWKAYCTECEVVTTMEDTGNRTEGLCIECGHVQKLVDNPKILKQMRDIQLEISNHTGRILMLQDQWASLGRMLPPIQVEKKPEWSRLTVEMGCYKCGRKTTRAFNDLPHCYPNCKPKSGKVSAEDNQEVIDMLREYLSGVNDDEVEVVKVKMTSPEEVEAESETEEDK